ncbi:glutenin, high molecular weight subunit DX5 [Plutella xylostella]|uniref:glutenin, high molecular weight subunit DX5 n=1 Tax=Plutella xylostella TaxID=51655 RepID=UPI002032F9B1|nr:glutenin, high molecular weight subunit DX5 [Plutella xylostella]
MAAAIWLVLVLCACAGAAPPAPAPRTYPHPQHPQQAQLQQLQHAQQLQQLNTLDYYLDNSEAANYYQSQQRKGAAPSNQNGAPSRLETLEPDSEVELIPGAQQPQQPPQQSPSPNIPGLIPGQRVYIINMPVPGYRPGTIGGYQPVYVVAAAPGQGQGQGGQGVQGVQGVPGGYQNAILLDPSGQGVISPFLGYQRPGFAGLGPNGYLINGQNQFVVNRPYDLYQDPAAFGFQPIAGPLGPGPAAGGQGAQGGRPQGSVRLSQLIALQAQPHAAGADGGAASQEKTIQQSERSRLGEASEGSAETKESLEDVEEPMRRNARPIPPHAQRNKPQQ